MRLPLAISSAALVALVGGCGVVHDMRSEYVANRALADAQVALRSTRPDREQALDDLDLGYRLRSHDARFVARLGGPYQIAGDFGKALECYEAAEAETGKPLNLEIGYCLLKLGEPERGVERVERALTEAMVAHEAGEMGPTQYAGVLNDAGYGLVDADTRVDEAVELVERAVEMAPLQPAFIDSLGWAYYRQGRYEDAAFHLERAARLIGREDAEILWHLGAVHARLHQLRRAERELTQALKLDASNEEAEGMLRNLLRELPPPSLS